MKRPVRFAAERPGAVVLALALTAVLSGAAPRGEWPAAGAAPTTLTSGAAFRTGASADPCETWIGAQAWARSRVFWIDAAHPAATDAGPGSFDRPWKSPAPVRRSGVLSAGDAVVLRAGVYTVAIRPAAAGTGEEARITFAACPGETVTIDGSDPLEALWTRVGDAWRTSGFEPQGPVEGRHDRHLFTSDGRVLEPRASVEALEPGTFFLRAVSDERAELAVRLPGDADPNRSHLRIGRRGTLFGPPEASEECPADPAAGWYRLIGLRFEHGANSAQRGAVCVGGSGVIAEDVTVTWTNGLGIEMVGRGHTLRRSEASDNGQAGIGGMCDDCLLEDVRSDRNNWKDHNRFWEAGGGKWTDTHRTTFRRYSASDNDGVGLWLDGDATDNVVEDADIRGSEVAALMFELGSDRNRVVRGRFASTRYRAWSGSGILQQAAGSNRIEDSIVEANEGSGVWVRVDDRAPTGILSVVGSTFLRNASAGRDDDFDVRIDQDVAPGAPDLLFDFERNEVRPVSRASAFGLARDRGKATRAARPSDFWANVSALRVIDPGSD